MHNYAEHTHFSKLVVVNPDHDHSPNGATYSGVTFQFGSLVAPGKALFVVIDNRLRAVVGEDLYALRELLNNDLPEEAFVKPADPVTVPDWTDGDVVRLYGGPKRERVWTRDNGLWFSPNHEGYLADREIDAVVHRRRPLAENDTMGRRADVMRKQRA